MGEADAEALIWHGAFREVLHGGAQLRQGVLLHHLSGSPQREQVEAQTEALQLQQLLEDERLGEPREAVDDNGKV